MIKSAFLRRMLLIILTTLFLSAALIGIVFTSGTQSIFTERSMDDLQRKANFLGDTVSQYLVGRMPRTVYSSLIRSTTSTWESTSLLIVSSNGEILAQTQFDQRIEVDIFSLESLNEQINKVMNGEKAWLAGTLPDANVSLIMLGQPVLGGDGGQIAAVFLFRPMFEINAATNSLNKALMFSMMAVLFLMIPVAYVASMRLISPLKSMRDVALTMASGNFTIQANEIQKGEIGELARSLNYLAFELSRTISELVLERNRLMRLIDGLSEGMAAVGATNELTHVNPALMSFFGLDENAHSEALCSHPDFAIVMSAFSKVTASNEPCSFDMKLGPLILRVGVSPLSSEEGKAEGAVALFRDVTESERLEQTRRDYVANVSHEMRTPLTALRGLIEPLNDGLVKNEQDKLRYYQIIYKETLRLSRLIDDLLELSRLQSGGVSMEREDFDLTDLLRSFSFAYGNSADQLGITLAMDIPDGPLTAHSNPDRVEQVLVILFDNALKFTPHGGRISIAAKAVGGEIELSVSDSGIGISKEDIPNVFDRFYKADKAHGEPGTGLGLSIAREIIRLMGGHIRVKSEQGHGATFTFTIEKGPLIDSEPNAE